ncbi:co-chaperone GroES [Streptococcus caviae]|uniref:co-chaperone GroES n=1 Tax=Streptococcus sp. 'caviae' TaxID=1915004 RepID=UPI00094BA73A|nr:co-chaperone GroES [Streptococcus sp. 'caviae']OLN83142.1 co-chaperone GroES [Streptococcus sp. 'caviae']
MLKPLGDRVVVQVIKEEEKTVGGFVLAGASQDKTQKATVAAVGEGIRTLSGDLVAPSIAEGDTVLLESHVGTPVKDGDEDYLIVREADILAVVQD